MLEFICFNFSFNITLVFFNTRVIIVLPSFIPCVEPNAIFFARVISPALAKDLALVDLHGCFGCLILDVSTVLEKKHEASCKNVAQVHETTACHQNGKNDQSQVCH